MSEPKRPRILLVEDVEDNREILRQLTAIMQVGLLEANDGVEALKVAREELPDLILMDLSLPRMDGWEATRRLKADPVTAHIPVIALSAHALDDARTRAFEAGVSDYVTKPISLMPFRQTLERTLGGGARGGRP